MKPIVGKLFFAAASLAAVLLCASVAAERETLTYHSPEVDCGWLDMEYDRIKSYADPDRRKDAPSVTKEGVMMTFGMILSLPRALFDEVFGEKGPVPDFSLDPDDVAAAAAAKQCAALLARIQSDKAAEQYPPPARKDR